MSLALNGEHVELAQAVRGWAARNCPRETVRAAADGQGPAPADPARYVAVLAPSLGAQGLLGLHLREDCGGQGYGLPELAIAVEELGRALVPGGFLPTVLASALLAAAVARPGNGGGKLLAGLADGSRSAAVSLAPGLTARGDGDGGLIVDGMSSPVAGAALADVLILPVQGPDGEAWAAVDAADLEITPAGSLDLSRPAGQVRAAGLRVPGRPGAGRPDPRRRDQPGRGPGRRGGGRPGRLGHGGGGGTRPDPAPVRPPDRPVPGG